MAGNLGYDVEWKYIDCDLCELGNHEPWITTLHTLDGKEFNVCMDCRRKYYNIGECERI